MAYRILSVPAFLRQRPLIMPSSVPFRLVYFAVAGLVASARACFFVVAPFFFFSCCCCCCCLCRGVPYFVCLFSFSFSKVTTFRETRLHLALAVAIAWAKPLFNLLTRCHWRLGNEQELSKQRKQQNKTSAQHNDYGPQHQHLLCLIKPRPNSAFLFNHFGGVSQNFRTTKTSTTSLYLTSAQQSSLHPEFVKIWHLSHVMYICWQS